MGGTGETFLLIERSQARALQALQLGSFLSNVQRRRQRDLGQKTIGLDWQNNNSAIESRFFLHFFAELNNMAGLRQREVTFSLKELINLTNLCNV